MIDALAQTIPAALRGPAQALSSHAARRTLTALLGEFKGGTISLTEGSSLEPHVLGTEADDAGRPSLRAQVHVQHATFWSRLLAGGSIGGAEAFMDGLFRTNDLVATCRLFVRNRDRMEELERRASPLARAATWAMHRLRRNTPAGSRRNIIAHYDLGVPFFSTFLDETLTYSCGIFANSDTTLHQAAIAKLELVCRKLDLRPGDRVVEIGSGWGGFALYAAQHYGCHVTTTTVSADQFRETTARVAAAGLQDRITVLARDYRDMTGTFDKLVSIEMVEAVGHEYFETFFQRCSDLLTPQGRMLFQAITLRDQYYEQARRRVDFIQHYVFPGACIPSMTRLLSAVTDATNMRLVHAEDIGPHYALTLKQWRERFIAARPAVRALGKSPEMCRLWEFYLAYCEAGFAERQLGCHQIVLHKPAVLNAHPSAAIAQ